MPAVSEDLLEVRSQARGTGAPQPFVRERHVPVGDLDAYEDTHHDDHQVDPDRGPFLLADVLDYAA